LSFFIPPTDDVDLDLLVGSRPARGSGTLAAEWRRIQLVSGEKAVE
jgi:hypothetical protein